MRGTRVWISFLQSIYNLKLLNIGKFDGVRKVQCKEGIGYRCGIWKYVGLVCCEMEEEGRYTPESNGIEIRSNRRHQPLVTMRRRDVPDDITMQLILHLFTRMPHVIRINKVASNLVDREGLRETFGCLLEGGDVDFAHFFERFGGETAFLFEVRGGAGGGHTITTTIMSTCHDCGYSSR